MLRVKRTTIAALAAGCLLLAGVQQTAEAAAKYVLTQVNYPVHVNGIPYVDENLPILNYKGSTYVPLKSIATILGDHVVWNTAAKRVDITPAIPEYANPAFRITSVAGQDGRYTVKGQGRVFEAVMSYRVTDGKSTLLDKTLQLNAGAPSWVPFKLELTLPKDQLPKDGTLHLELYETSMKDGQPIHVLPIHLQTW
ncbi:Gmad2 immunoglobulin-like domain-containing protein [Gorillibacterium timonense]|uniref:Gmad2 immunoglobulin-like domain-containing protein n=1 Tax=Gorillibacterium timonense TaxID=1689269 RepID=UPI00071D5291|nr:Gmad2 immunoglobulin-like domain-containing protein [Gorillibacterium timonense]